MRRSLFPMLPLTLIAAAALLGGTALAHGLRPSGEVARIADSPLSVTPQRDWNRLSGAPGKKTEVWTLDGEALNDITFYAGIEPGMPLIRERNKSRKPLPKFTHETLLVEVPELLEGTYRAGYDVATFTVTGARPDTFLGRDGIRFTFDYVDEDALPRRGEGRAALVDGRLYMVVFAAPRLAYFDRTIGDYRALTDSARLN